MTEPKTAQQHNSQIVGTLEISKSRETALTHDLLKLKVALRLLVEKWREESYSEDISHPNPPMLNSITLKKCAKELEEALK